MLVTDHKAMPSFLWPHISKSGLFSIPVWPAQRTPIQTQSQQIPNGCHSSYASFSCLLQRIQEKIPTDPFEAELLMMAEMVAGEKKGDNSDSDSDDGANCAGDVSEVPGGRQNVKYDARVFVLWVKGEVVALCVSSMRVCGGWSCSSTHSSPWHWVEVSGHPHAPPTLPPVKVPPVSIKWEAGWAPDAVWTCLRR